MNSLKQTNGASEMSKKIKIKNEVKTGKSMTTLDYLGYEEEETPTIDAPDYYPLGCMITVEEEGFHTRIMQAVGNRNFLM